ncbi:hypothetical protein DFH11DRAFT_1548695 [Phellopilus nigrolimitatus]|nr:hypothetical protein DFH11DRAFT_1548695 [Phellopilus nigrolimitatus]
MRRILLQTLSHAAKAISLRACWGHEGLVKPMLFEKGIYQAEAQFEFESTRYVSSPTGLKILARNDISVPIEGKSTLTQDGSEKAYLKDLFPSKGAQETLEKLRKQIKKISEDLPKHTIQSSDADRNHTIVKELASVLNMQLSLIKSWSWPSESVLLKPRRHLNENPPSPLPHFFLDAEMITCLLLHYLRLVWSNEYKDSFKLLRSIRIWKLPNWNFVSYRHSALPLDTMIIQLDYRSDDLISLKYIPAILSDDRFESPEQRLICEKATLAMGNSLYGSTFVDAVIRSPIHEGGYGQGGVPDFRNHLTVKYHRMIILSDGEVEHASTTEHVIFKKEKELILPPKKSCPHFLLYRSEIGIEGCLTNFKA